MRLCQVVAVAALWTFGNEALQLTQPHISITTKLGKTARVTCKVSDTTSFSSEYVHWYQQKPNQPLQHLLFIQSTSNSNKISVGDKVNKFVAVKIEDQGISILAINEITHEDEATYYCAGWVDDGTYIKVFGSGTKLIVTDSINKKKPTPIFFLPTSEEVKQKKSGTYICLLENFSPNVVKSYWKDEKSRPLDAQFGPITETNGLYSQVSWLTVEKDALRKNLTYSFQHEEEGIEPVTIPLSSMWEVFKNDTPSCEKTEVKNNGLQELHFANTSAFYTYTILLVKSTIYFAITLFFLYQKGAAGSWWTK